MAYEPDWSVLNMQGHQAPMPDMPPTPATAMPPRDPLIASLLASTAQGAAPAPDPTNDYYKYAILAGLLGSTGAGIGQAFRPWVRPPQPVASPQAPQMPITAPASINALAQTRSARKGF